MGQRQLSFPAKVKDTGCGVRKITLPDQTLKWVTGTSPDIEFLDEARLTRFDRPPLVIDSPKLSKGTKGKRYFALPKKMMEENEIPFDEEFQVIITWSD